MPRSRNPKHKMFTVGLTVDQNKRFEALADSVGANLTAMAGICFAVGLNQLEAFLLANGQLPVADLGKRQLSTSAK